MTVLAFNAQVPIIFNNIILIYNDFCSSLNHIYIVHLLGKYNIIQNQYIVIALWSGKNG